MGTERSEAVQLQIGDALGNAVTTLLTLPFRALALVVMVFVSPLRMFAPMAMMSPGRGMSSRSEVQIPVTPFTVRCEDGRLVEVVMRGELSGGSLHLGDRIEVQGRTGRAGVVEARCVTNLDTGGRTTPRTHPAVRQERAKLIASVILIVLLLWIVISLASAMRT